MDTHSTFIDTVEVEKAKAIARYRRFRNLAKLLQVLEIVVALVLLSWSSTRLPAAIKFSGRYLLEFYHYFLNPHVVFIVGNVIVIALFVLYRQIGDGSGSDNADLFDGYVDERENHTAIGAVESQPSPPSVTDEMIGEAEKQIASKENAVRKRECEAAAMAIKRTAKQMEKFERTQSEKFKRDISTKPQKEFRRSETEVRRVVVTSGGNSRTIRKMTEFERVDTLSSEEFRLTVEAFIKKQQNILRQQKMAEIE